MNHLNEIAETVRAIVECDEHLYFDELKVKTTPHSLPVCIDGVCVSHLYKVFISENKTWREVKPHEKAIIHSLSNCVNLIASHLLQTA